MGCGTSVPQNNSGQAPVTRVVPASQPVSEASGLTFQQAESGRSKPSLVKVFSLDKTASPQQVLQGLLDGNERFRDGCSAHPHQDALRVQQISARQTPLAAILGCADSRVPTEMLFDQGFGDVFCCRVAGNIATSEELASLEYAVVDLGVKVIMILGHTSCGAVKAALSGKHFPGLIEVLVEQMDVAITRADSVHANVHPSVRASMDKTDQVNQVVRENVKYQVQRCERSVVIHEAVARGDLLLAGAVYDLATGRVEVLLTRGAQNQSQTR